jgi:hypothetical protein
MISEPLLINSGRQFGGDGGDNFDDSSSEKFTPSHYVSGFIFSDIDGFDACQFIYTSSHDNQSRIESDVHDDGGNKINSTHKYSLNADERIDQVQFKSYNRTFINNGQIANIIRGLKFVTTKGQRIPPGLLLKGNDVQSKNFTEYTLGYVTERLGGGIDQLQFFWYRTKQ